MAGEFEVEFVVAHLMPYTVRNTGGQNAACSSTIPCDYSPHLLQHSCDC